MLKNGPKKIGPETRSQRGARQNSGEPGGCGRELCFIQDYSQIV